MKIHIVQKGDTLWEIAKQYGVDFDELKQFNSQIASPDMIMPGMKIKIPSSSKSVQQASDTKPVKMEKTEKQFKEHPATPTESVKSEVAKEKPKATAKAMPHMPEIPQMPVLGGEVNMETPKKYEKPIADSKPKEVPKPDQFKDIKPAQEHTQAYTHPVMPVMPMCHCQPVCPCCSQMKPNHMHHMGQMQGPFMRPEHVMYPEQRMLPPEATGQNGQQWQGFPEQVAPQYANNNAYYPRFTNEQQMPPNMYQENPTNVPGYHHPMNHIQPSPPNFAPFQPFDGHEENK